jgi:hypothetical protein
MNDNFLYELRSPPPPEFASRLKARLDLQASEARQKRRSFTWFVVGAILMGGTALAFVSPAVRQATLAKITQWRGATASEHVTSSERQTLARTVQPASAPRNDRSLQHGSAADLQIAERESPPASRDGEVSRPAAVPESSTTVLGPAVGTTIVNPSASARAPVRIGHYDSLTSLAEGLALELEGRWRKMSVVTSRLPAQTDVCSGVFDAENIDILLSTHRESEAPGGRCYARSKRFVELAFAYEAIVVIVHRENTWARSITFSELKVLQEPEPALALSTWSQLRAEWPTLPLSLVGTSLQQSELGIRFADAVGLRRNPSVFEMTKDDAATMKIVENTLGALGYVDFGTLTRVLKDRTARWPTVAAIVNAKGEAVEPSVASIQERKYELSRPIWAYVDVSGLRRPETMAVLEEIFELRSPDAIADSGLVPLGRTQRKEAMLTLARAR